jgi:thiol-disulfide isomerase/thioredoxin
VFVDAYTTWCGPCKWMSKNVFTDASVGEFYNKNFINLKLDMEKGEGLVFAAEFEVNVYPTLLFVDSEGELLHKHLGAIPADQLITVGQDALSPDKRLSSFMKKYESNKYDKEFLHDYIVKMLNAGYQVSEAADNYFTLLDNEEFVTRDNLMILQMWRPSSSSRAFDLLYKNRRGFIAIAGEEPVYGLLEGILTSDLYNSVAGDDPEAFHRVQSKVQSLDVPFKDKLASMGNMIYSESQSDMKGYLRHTSEYSKKYHWNDWNTLNNLAWEMYLNEALQSPKEMKLARKLGKRAVKLESNYYTTDTYAATLFKSGKYSQALEWANTAVDLAKKAAEDYSVTAELIENIHGAMKDQN